MTELRIPQHRDVPREWEARLAEFSPPTNRFKWLKLIWEKGYAWEPVERYMIYEMLPERAMTSAFQQHVLEQLRDFPPPSEMGNYYDSVKGEFVNNPDCLITERAWHLYRETRCWGRPWWVIQGDKGGHRRWLSPVERQLLRLNGLPPDPPAPGDLPYADFDDRVMEKLEQHDLLRGVHDTLKRRASLIGNSTVQALKVDAQKSELRRQLLAFLRDQVEEVGHDVAKSMMALDTPRRDIDVKALEAMQEEAEENFVQTGRTGANLSLLKGA